MAKWTDEAIELLRVEWSDGSSAAACADAINGRLGLEITRNAVIGKVHRMGLPEHPSFDIGRKLRAEKRRQSQIASIRREGRKLATQLKQISPEIPGEVIYYKSVPFFELESHHCRYAVSGDHGREYQFCSNQRWRGSSYCAEHTRLTSAKVIYSSEGKRFASRRNLLATEQMLHTLSIKEEGETP